MFLPISFARAKEVGERKRAKGVPLDPLRNLRFDAEVGNAVILSETSDRQKSGGRIAEGKRTVCFGLRVMVDRLYG